MPFIVQGAARRQRVRLIARHADQLAKRPGIRFFASGRLAVYTLLAHLAQDRTGAEVLLPAYHCTALVDACKWAGLTPRFYNVEASLAPDVEHFESQLSHNTCAAIFIHYFGFPNRLDATAEMCRQGKVWIIEDAAHVDVLLPETASEVGIHGDWVIGGMRKFYPVYDGACVYPCSPAAVRRPLPSASAPLAAEARAVRFMLERVREGRVKPGVAAGDVDPDEASREQGPNSGYRDWRFTISDRMGMTRTSRLALFGMAGHGDGELRRKNYSFLLTLSSTLRGCTPLHRALPKGVSPYMFPMVVDGAVGDEHKRIRSAGVESLRWENLFESECSVSRAYERRLIQLPCHQGLASWQLRHMKRTLIEIFGKSGQ